MEAERWQIVKNLVETALKLSVDERNKFLAVACINDDALKKEVESLLKYYQKADSFLESSPINNLKEQLNNNNSSNDKAIADIPETRIISAQEIFTNTSTDPLIGKILDEQYEIETLLGIGGMGRVYRAKHKLLKRQVAIKVMSPLLITV